MATDSVQTPSVSPVAASLENAIALAISRAHAIVDDGTANSEGLAAADPEELADALAAANALVSKLEDIRHGIALAAIDREHDDAEPEETHPDPDDLHDEIGRAWNDAMQQLYAVRDLAHLLDIADDRAETVGYVIEREAERGIEAMNKLERLLCKRRQEDDEQRAVDNADDLESRAYARGLRDGLWQADQSIRQAVKDLRIDRMNSDGSFADDKQEPGK